MKKLSLLLSVFILFNILGCSSQNNENTLEKKRLELERKELELEKRAFELDKIESSRVAVITQKLPEKESIKTEISKAEPKPLKIKYSEPEEVVEELIRAARTGDFSEFKNLCDFTIENKHETLCLCDLGKVSETSGDVEMDCNFNQKSFMEVFKETLIEKEKILIHNNSASVPVYAIRNNKKTKYGFIQVRKKGNRWFLCVI